MKPLVATILIIAAFGLGIAVDRLLFKPSGSHSEGGESYYLDDTSTDPGLLPRAENGAAESSGDSEERKARGGAAASGRSFRGGIDSLLSLVDPSSWGRDDREIRDALRGAGAADVLQLLEKLDTLDESDSRAAGVRRAVFERYAEVDPKAALSKAMDLSDDDLRRHVIHHAFEHLAKSDLTAALAIYEELDDREEFRHTAVRSMSRGVDPEQIPQLAEFLKKNVPDARHFGEMFSRWAHRDPSAATTFILGLDDDELKRHWIGAAGYGWAQRNSEAALAWLETLDSESERTRAAEGIMHSLVRKDPVAASELVDILRSGDRQRHFAGEIARQWARKDIEAAKKWVESLPTGVGDHALRLVLREWTRTDPESAAGYLDQMAPSENITEAMHELARTWARKDIEAAATWALNAENSAGRLGALSSIADQWAQKDPTAAAGFVAALEDPRERRELLDNISHNWAENDLNAAIAWVGDLDPADRSYAARGIMWRVAESDPDHAVGLLSQFTAGLSNEDLSKGKFHEVAGAIAHRWGSHSPAEAAQWAENLPEGSNMQRSAVERVADRWADNDSMAASEWIVQLPEGRLRDVATGQLVENIVESDPDSAFRWALSTSNDGHRNKLLREVVEHWAEIDPNQARATLDATELDPKLRERLNRELD